ncbi:MAG: hypothetical protein EPN26_16435 [Rhodospirillales bacterium]|nr:MAG: hypothetical protein EPN26_16435 [Rhodospirillales bacterium]
MSFIRFTTALCLVFLLAACPKLPRPFEHGTTNPLLDLDGKAGVILAFDQEIPENFAAAIQSALAKRDVPARLDNALPGALPLHLRARRTDQRGGSADMELFWELHDAEGLIIDHYDQRVRVNEKEWEQGNPLLMKRLAEEAAPKLAGLMPVEDGARPSDSPVAQEAKTLLLLERVEGAPSDGNAALARSMRLALSVKNITMAEGPGDDVFRLIGKVKVDKAPPASQRLHIDWILTDPHGGEMAVLEQDGAVPEGLLDKPWGPLAGEIVAGTAQDLAGLLKEAGKALKPRS